MESKCSYCNKSIPPDSTFCVHCGKIISLDKAATKSTVENLDIPQKEKSNSRLSTYLNISIFLLAIACIGGFIYYYVETKINTPADKDANNEMIVGNLYRNTKYKFRIKFPDQWEIKKGDGPSILVKALSGAGGSINIAITDIGIAIGPIDQLFTIDEWAVSLSEELPEATILDKREVFIDNRKAYLAEYSFKYKTLDKEIDMISYNVALTNKNYMYIINASSRKNQFNELKKIIDQSIRTFALEDYFDKEKVPAENNFVIKRDSSKWKIKKREPKIP